MSKLPTFKRIAIEGLTDAPKGDWLPRLIEPVNALMESTGGTLNHGITVEQNLAAQFHSFTVKVPDDWVAIATAGAADPAYKNSWVAYNLASHANPGIRKNHWGRVDLRGLIMNGTAGLAAFTLPPAYRPSFTHNFISLCSAASGVGRTEIRANGDVVPIVGGLGANGYYSLDGCSFDPTDRQPVVPACWPYIFSIRSKSKPKAVLVSDVVDSSTQKGYAGPAAAPDWEYSNKDGTSQVKVRSILGLTPGRSYTVTLLVVER